MRSCVSSLRVGAFFMMVIICVRAAKSSERLFVMLKQRIAPIAIYPARLAA
jgi:hypothetical protein